MKIFKKVFNLILVICITSISCKKTKEEIDTCSYDSCDPRRKTIQIAQDLEGKLGYFNELRKWAVNVSISGTYDSTLVCILCKDIPDSLKTIGRTVTFSGEIKESCGYPKSAFFGQGIYYVNQTKLK
jgi:hypothetical protein